ncbi:MAG: hypothetical protein RLZZ70_302 [Candidatus Parcubacteria bacterium]|jgi:hypothetical protein
MRFSVVAVLFFFPGQALADDDNILLDIVDMQGTTLYEVVGCTPVYDLRLPDEPIVAWNPNIRPVPDSRLQEFPYLAEPDGNEKVLHNGDWVRVDDTEYWQNLLYKDDHCHPMS